jgi:hypothetical protein
MFLFFMPMLEFELLMLPFFVPMLEFVLLMLLFFMPMLEFEPPILPLDIEPPFPFDIVPPVLPPIVEFDVFMVVVLVLVVVLFILPELVLSVVQPVQKAATASKAKRAKVLRIEFFSCNPTGQLVKSCAVANSRCQPPQQLGQCLRLTPLSQRLPAGTTESWNRGRLSIISALDARPYSLRASNAFVARPTAFHLLRSTLFTVSDRGTKPVLYQTGKPFLSSQTI